MEAAAIAHKATGLPIASHTVDGAAAHQELDILDAHGVSAGAFIWVHAHNESDDAPLKRAAERGAWVEFDGIGPDSVDRHVQLVKMMADAGHLGRVLVSHDAGWYHVGRRGRRHLPSIRHRLPPLRAGDQRKRSNEAAVTQLLVSNPARALSRRV